VLYGVREFGRSKLTSRSDNDEYQDKGLNVIYFNNTATSYPKPKEVTDAVIEYLNHPPVHSSRTGLERSEEDVDYACRANLARLFNADEPLHFVLTSGSTEALNLAIRGLDLKGAHVVSTAIEHNSVIRPLKTLERDGAITVDFVKCDEYAYVRPEWIDAAFRPNTKAVIVNHCSNVTGTILDLKAISDVAHAHGAVLIVDASQSAGMIPIDVKSWDIDYLAFTGHKSLFGMPGTGGLYMKRPFELEPLKTGGTGVKSEVLLQPKEMTMYYEAGTPNTPGIVSLNAGVKFVLKEGIDKILNHKKELIGHLMEKLNPLPEITTYCHPKHSSHSNFCFNIKGMTPEEVNYALESMFDIYVRSGLHCAPLLLQEIGVYPWGTVRASPSYFSTTDDTDEFIAAVKEIINTFVRK
jgi:cysteine desulfurase/selenocysteine lyase